MKRRYRYQQGGERKAPVLVPGLYDRPLLPPVLMDPRTVVHSYGASSNRPASDISGYFRLPGRGGVEPVLQDPLVAEEEARKAAAEKLKAQQGSLPVLPSRSSVVRGDLAGSFDLPKEEVYNMHFKVALAQQDKLKNDLQRLGYSAQRAELFARKGKRKLEPFMQKQLDDLALEDYRVQHHPDFDPNKSVESQQNLNYDNTLRTKLLRGRNMLVDTGNPVTDFLAETLTAPGKAFVNLTMDADKQYFQPGVLQGATNFGSDVLTLFPSTAANMGERVAGRLMNTGLPESSVLLERSLGRPVFPTSERAPYAPTDFIKNESNDFGEGLPNKNSFSTKNTKAFKEDVKKAAYDYYHLTKDPRYLDRVRVLDNELGTEGELERRLKLYHQQGEEGGRKLPFNIKVTGLSDGNLGGSQVHSDIVDRLSLKEMKGEMSPEDVQRYLETSYFSPQEREIMVSPNVQAPDAPMSLRDVIWHEKKHHWLNSLRDEQGGIQKYADWLSSPKTDPVMASLSDIPKKHYAYHVLPTEMDAYLMTNLRDELVRKKYLKDHFDVLSEETLNHFINDNLRNDRRDWSLWFKKYFTPDKELIGDKKKFVDVFNKALPVAAGVTVGANALSEQKRWGGGIGRRGIVPALPFLVV
jgi:hypothetical protein